MGELQTGTPITTSNTPSTIYHTPNWCLVALRIASLTLHRASSSRPLQSLMLLPQNTLAMTSRVHFAVSLPFFFPCLLPVYCYLDHRAFSFFYKTIPTNSLLLACSLSLLALIFQAYCPKANTQGNLTLYNTIIAGPYSIFTSE